MHFARACYFGESETLFVKWHNFFDHFQERNLDPSVIEEILWFVKIPSNEFGYHHGGNGMMALLYFTGDGQSRIRRKLEMGGMDKKKRIKAWHRSYCIPDTPEGAAAIEKRRINSSIVNT